jgi:hypothetical protein
MLDWLRSLTEMNPLGAVVTVVAIGAWYNLRTQIQDLQALLENERRQREREIDRLHQDVNALQMYERRTRSPDLPDGKFAQLKGCKDKDKPEFPPRDEDPDAVH